VGDSPISVSWRCAELLRAQRNLLRLTEETMDSIAGIRWLSATRNISASRFPSNAVGDDAERVSRIGFGDRIISREPVLSMSAGKG